MLICAAVLRFQVCQWYLINAEDKGKVKVTILHHQPFGLVVSSSDVVVNRI